MLSLLPGSEAFMEAQRGKVLSGLIVLYAIAITLASLGLVFGRDQIARLIGSIPDWFNSYVAFLLLARLVALTAIWDFRRWGVYLLIFLECVEVALGLFVFTSFLTFPLRLLFALPASAILLAIWYLGLRPKWPAFR